MSFLNSVLDPSHKKLISRRRVVVSVKNLGQCSTSTKQTYCWRTQKCVQYTGYGYKKRCVRVRVQRRCNMVTTTTCKLCTKSLLKTCYRLHYGISCRKSHVKSSCGRKVSNKSFKTNVLVKTYFTRKY